MAHFSIVVPAYNAQATLNETLDAIVAQEYSDWECVTVDDGSVDDTLSIASGYAARDPRFRVISQVNMGSGGAYNTGVSEARGDLVVICSADDILLPQHLSEMARFIDANDGYDIYSSNGWYLKPDRSHEVVYAPGELGESLSLVDVILRCFYCVGAVYRRPLFDATGGYRVDIYGEDWDFWLRAMASGARHRYLPQPLSLMRVSPTQKSANIRAVYLSDIRTVMDLERSTHLSGEERKAVRESVSMRRRQLRRLAAVRLLGARRVDTLARLTRPIRLGPANGD